MYRSELTERIGVTLKRSNVPPVARAGITKVIMGEFKDILNEQIDSVIECCLLVLHENYGFGAKRCYELVQLMSEKVDTTYDSYGLDTLIKFQNELKNYGINYKTILDTRREQNGRS